MTAPAVLSETVRREIADEIERYPEPRAASVEALKAVQRELGWVSDEALAEVAAMLGMSVAALDNVATFYNLVFRRPVGDHVILVCDSVSCWVMDSEAVLSALRRTLGIAPGETTPDGRFTLLPVPCLGACDGAPALMIDHDLHTDVDPAHLDELLERYPARRAGQGSG
jgi:NADH-quinone oxidoreductase subunit E